LHEKTGKKLIRNNNFVLQKINKFTNIVLIKGLILEFASDLTGSALRSV